MYDNICKFLAETFPADLSAWLLGEPLPLTELPVRELSAEPIRADSLILQQTAELVLHAEFQTAPDASLPFRMADYRLRVYRRFPGKLMHQVAIYLRSSSSPLVYQDTFVAAGLVRNLRHEFAVLRLWEQPSEVFLQRPGLLPLAVLAQTDDREAVLRQAARQLEQLPDRREQSNLTASAVLAGLVFEQGFVQRILRSDIMRESTVYQEILREGRDEGIQQGLQQGRETALSEVARNLLQRGTTPAQVAEITGLPLAVVQALVSTESNGDGT